MENMLISPQQASVFTHGESAWQAGGSGTTKPDPRHAAETVCMSAYRFIVAGGSVQQKCQQFRNAGEQAVQRFVARQNGERR